MKKKSKNVSSVLDRILKKKKNETIVTSVKIRKSLKK